MNTRKGALVVIAWAGLLTLGLATPASQSDELKEKVKSLLTNLETGPTDAARLTAEWDLLKLGPDILPILPPLEKTPPSTKDRLTGIRATLEELRPRTWEMTETRKMPLKDALDLLKKSTDLAVADRHLGSKIGEVKVEAGTSRYWQVVESLAKQTNSRLSLYQPDGQVALIDGPISKEPVDLHGLFRIAVKRISNRLDFDRLTSTGSLGLEIAWEPRFIPYLIEIGKLSFQYTPAPNGPPNPTSVAAASPVFVTEKNAKEFEVFFPSPPRSASSIRDLTGQFVVTMPAKLLAFAFKAPKQGDRKVQDSVQLTVSEITQEKERWTVVLTVEVPEAGPQLDSFQTWLGSRAWLSQAICEFERGAGENKEVLRPKPLETFTVGRQASNRVAVRYRFAVDNNAGTVDSWRLLCRVPGRLVEVTVPFAFAKIELP
jgi:hypothetical protein